MKEFAIENIDDALDIVSGNKLHYYKFDSLMESGEYNEETLKMMTSKLTENCENKLEILSPHGGHDSSISNGEPGSSEKDLSGKKSSNSKRIRKFEKNKDPLDIRNYNNENTPKVCDAATLIMNNQISR